MFYKGAGTFRIVAVKICAMATYLKLRSLFDFEKGYFNNGNVKMYDNLHFYGPKVVAMLFSVKTLKMFTK